VADAAEQSEPVEEGPAPPVWILVVFAGLALALLPWAATLNVILPSRHVARHWDLAWTGFDVGLAGGLAAVAVTAYRRSAWLPRFAMAAGTLLLTDAWFDVLTAGHGTDRTLSLAGLAIELPLAVLCFRIAWSGE
jgi:hypothetical protein